MAVRFQLRELTGVSKLELARRVRAAWLKRAPSERPKVPEPVAISNRLGDLERGDERWWTRRLNAVRAFEEVTGLAFRDLPLARDVVVSPDFPKLRPFRPGEEEPVDIAAPNWFAQPVGDVLRWIVAPPGSGRTFAVQWHRVRGGVQALETPRLADAVELASVNEPLVIGVEAPDPGDEAALRRIERRGAVVVIASFEPPATEGGSGPRARERWQVEYWRPNDGWRRALVAWVAGRIEESDTLFDAEQLTAWMDDVDAHGETFATPGDVIALCAFAHDAGVPSFRKDLGGRFVTSRIERVAAAGGDRGVWLKTWGLQVVRAIVNTRVRSLSLPMWQPLDRAQWAALVPVDVAPQALTESEIDEILDARIRSKPKARDLLRRRPAPEAIERLADARILRTHGAKLALPRWIGVAMARRVVGDAIQKDSTEIWGRWAVDPERRTLIDAQLDELTRPRLEELAMRVCREFDRHALGAVGAVEAVFAAVGRRLAPDWRVGDELRTLWLLQQSLLCERYRQEEPLWPRTRPGFEHGEDWVACCWRWSLYGPPAQVDARHVWLFPGWGEPSLAALGKQSRIGSGEPGWGGRGITPLREWSRFLEVVNMAVGVVERCRDVELPAEHIPSALVPAVVLTAHRRTPPWALGKEVVQTLLGTVWAAPVVVEMALQLPSDGAAAVARTIWAGIAQTEGGGLGAWSRLRANSRQQSLRDFLAARLTEHDVADVLTEGDARHLHLLRDVPRRLRTPFIRNAIARRPSELHLDIEDLPELGDSDVEWVEVLADAGQPPWRYRQTLWSISPARALERTLGAALADEVTAEWFGAAPADQRPVLLDHLERVPTPLPEWALQWLQRRILDSGLEADRAHALLVRDWKGDQ